MKTRKELLKETIINSIFLLLAVALLVLVILK